MFFASGGRIIGDGLRYNPHIHLCASEGVWVESEDEPGGLKFVPSEVPSLNEVCTLLERIQSRIVRHLRRLELIRKEETSSAETSGTLEFETIEKDRSPEEELLGEMQGCSIKNRFALSAPPGKAVRRERQTELGEFGNIGDRARLSKDGERLAILKGFSLHAGTSVPPKQDGDPPEPPGQGSLERLLRYMARNSTPLERLKPASNGDVLIKLRSRWNDGTTHLRFSGVEFCERLAAIIPHPRLNLIRFGGCFAPRHKLRARVVALAPKAVEGGMTATSPTTSSEEATEIQPQPKKYRFAWANLRARIFQDDLSHCRKCGGKIKVTNACLDREAITRILSSLGLPTETPRFAPPSRAPPDDDPDQSEFSWA